MISDTVAVAGIGAFATITTAFLAYLTVLAQRNQRNLADTKESVAKLEHHTDGMQATIERLATSAGIVLGREQVRSDMQAGADSPLIQPTQAAPSRELTAKVVVVTGEEKKL